MPHDLYAAYNSLSVARKKEVYNFIMNLSQKEKKAESHEKTPKAKNKFFGAIQLTEDPLEIQRKMRSEW